MSDQCQDQSNTEEIKYDQTRTTVPTMDLEVEIGNRQIQLEKYVILNDKPRNLKKLEVYKEKPYVKGIYNVQFNSKIIRRFKQNTTLGR